MERHKVVYIFVHIANKNYDWREVIVLTYVDTEKLVDTLINDWFTDNKIKLGDNETGDSCNYHAMTHMDTEILGAFCDMTAIHGEELKEVLTRGYLAKTLR